MSFVIQAKAFDKIEAKCVSITIKKKEAKCVSITITVTSSNINELIRVILNFFIHKKAQNAYKQIKIKRV